MNKVRRAFLVNRSPASLASLALLAALALSQSIAMAQTQRTQQTSPTLPLVGAWTLTAADVIKPDGTRTQDYGPNPHGLAVFTADGHCSVAIYRSDRLKFASNDKRQGTPEEYKEASLGMSTHFGICAVDTVKGTITFKIDSASFPNWDGTTQVRQFTLTGDELSWRVPPRPDGSVPVSSFKRVR